MTSTRLVRTIFNGFTLSMCTWNSRNTTYEQTRFEVAFNDSVEVHAHSDILTSMVFVKLTSDRTGFR
jgi:hypothetical protein